MDSSRKNELKPLYVCPMHPSERSNEPGKCGICFMPLERLPAPPTDTRSWYVCLDHPEPQYTGPGKCPRCGKVLEPADD